RLGAGGHPGGQRRVVDAAVVPADDERDAAAGKRVQGGQGGQDIGGQAVVDEGDAVDGGDRGQPAGQVLVALGRLAQLGVVGPDTHGGQAAARDQRVAPVVLAEQAER